MFPSIDSTSWMSLIITSIMPQILKLDDRIPSNQTTISLRLHSTLSMYNKVWPCKSCFSIGTAYPDCFPMVASAWRATKLAAWPCSVQMETVFVACEMTFLFFLLHSYNPHPTSCVALLGCHSSIFKTCFPTKLSESMGRRRWLCQQPRSVDSRIGPFSQFQGFPRKINCLHVEKIEKFFTWRAVV